MRVVRHYLRYRQENLGADLNVDIGQGTCTMKYSPKVNDTLIRTPKLAELHPLQDEATLQGILEIFWRTRAGARRDLRHGPVTPADPGRLRRDLGQRLHDPRLPRVQRRGPACATRSSPRSSPTRPTRPAPRRPASRSSPCIPDADGYPDLEALRAAVSARTAALMITNPEDTGIFNPRSASSCEIVHEAGGLCRLRPGQRQRHPGHHPRLGRRVRPVPLQPAQDLLHPARLRRTGCRRQRRLRAAGAVPARPAHRKDDGRLHRGLRAAEKSIGKVAPFFGVAPNVVRAYAWIMSLGAAGLRQVAEIAVLNNNYLLALVRRDPGRQRPVRRGQAPHRAGPLLAGRSLFEETGISSEEIGIRMADFGMHYWTSHHPYVVPEPFTLEPTESYSKADLDEYAAVLAKVATRGPGEPRARAHRPAQPDRAPDRPR